jgi:polysaccharide export outer membrane protein
VQIAPVGLAPGDLLGIRLYDFPDLGGSPMQVHVSPEGTIHLPYAGTLQASGMLPAALEKSIGDALRTKGIVKEPNVTVEVVSSVNLTVNVVGQVLTPRSIPLYAPAPISFIMGQVGGPTGLAAHHLTIIRRGDTMPQSVDYDPDVPTAAAFNTLVQPGDIVSVSSRGVYFIVGEVNRPGIYPMGGSLMSGAGTATMGMVKNVTLLQALAQAGGITAIAARSKMHILRTVDGKREDIVVDEVKLSKGQVADPLLHPDDIIYLPPSYLRQQTNNLFSTALSGLYGITQAKSAGFY